MSAVAFGPGRANLIGEHTDYNDGLSLPFAIEQGVTVTARVRDDGRVVARALDRGEEDRFPVADPPRARGWRAFVRGTVAELRRAGYEVPAADLDIEGGVAVGAGLGSSAALAVALSLALLALAGIDDLDRVTLAKLCSRVENDWVGANTGLLDQLASLLGERGHALRIDFRSLRVERVPLDLGDWRLVALDSGEQRSHARSGYNQRRSECDEAREVLGLASLRDATLDHLPGLRPPLGDRVRHVIDENARVDATVRALRDGDLDEVGRILDAGHGSLRDLYAASTGAIERTVADCTSAGAAGARMMGGGFGGQVLALFPPGATPPPGAVELVPGRGAHLT